MGPLPTLFDTADGPARFIKLHGSVLWWVERNWDQNRDYYLGNPNAGEVRYGTFCEAVTSLGGGRFPWLPATIFPHRTGTFLSLNSEAFRKWESEPADMSDCRRVEPLIVPPTIAKEEHLARPEISELWRQAEHDLSLTSSIYVIGYSFPRTDKHVEKMTQAAAKRRPCGSYKGVPVTVVTRPNAEKDEVEGLERRVTDAFPGADTITVARDESGRTIGFAEWVCMKAP
ncbi:MAG: hypothetical protein Q8Q12_19680 [bacterium]|nr:hypothetical protein [bacterium]